MIVILVDGSFVKENKCKGNIFSLSHCFLIFIKWEKAELKKLLNMQKTSTGYSINKSIVLIPKHRISWGLSSIYSQKQD